MRALLAGKPPRTRADAVDRTMQFHEICGSKGFALDIGGIRRRAGESYDRCFYPRGFARQLAAVVASGNRAPALRRLDLPTLVIHGKADPIIPVANGEILAGRIPNAEYLSLDGVGHLPAVEKPLETAHDIVSFAVRNGITCLAV